MARHPNSLANLGPAYKRGAEWTGNAKGGRRLGATIKDWWNALSREDENGVPKYTMKQIAAFADAPDDDPKVSSAKKIAAQHLVEMARGGRYGREITALVFDRTEGKAPQNVNLTGGPAVKRIVLSDERILPVIDNAKLLEATDG